nr:uncharacterized protein LOC103346935 [Oryctolagus cuniculus]
MPGALLLSASGSNGQRRARQKPGGLTSIQGAQEAGRRGPWVTGWRGRPASGPGASDAGRSRQRAGASRGATAAARGECACARRCAPEVAPCAPEVAPCGPRHSGRSPRGSRPLLPESPREPLGAVVDAASGACGRPSAPGVRPGSERLRPEAAAPFPGRGSLLQPLVEAAAFAGLCAASRPGPLGASSVVEFFVGTCAEHWRQAFEQGGEQPRATPAGRAGLLVSEEWQ